LHGVSYHGIFHCAVNMPLIPNLRESGNIYCAVNVGFALAVNGQLDSRGLSIEQIRAPARRHPGPRPIPGTGSIPGTGPGRGPGPGGGLGGLRICAWEVGAREGVGSLQLVARRAGRLRPTPYLGAARPVPWGRLITVVPGRKAFCVSALVDGAGGAGGAESGGGVVLVPGSRHRPHLHRRPGPGTGIPAPRSRLLVAPSAGGGRSADSRAGKSERERTWGVCSYRCAAGSRGLDPAARRVCRAD